MIHTAKADGDQLLHMHLHYSYRNNKVFAGAKPYAAMVNQQDTRVLMPAGDQSIPLGTANTRAAAAPVTSVSASTAG